MIPTALSRIGTASAPSLGNHLWQSTLFACTIALLTLALRNNRAQIRYWLWLAASMKFLVPFSLLIGLGGHLASSRASAPRESALYFAIEQVGKPFPRDVAAAIPRAAPLNAFEPRLVPALLAVWLGGFAVVLLLWCVRWRRISATARKAMPVYEGREVEVLRCLENSAGMAKRVPILSSRSSLEPGIFGITRPVLLWPQEITNRLEDAHLRSVLAHELLHVRRRDNLAAAVHMFVEAVYWFHPLVWWMGTRLVDERERACDEAVLESGADRQIYAESILRICEFCVGSHLPCVSGVTGAELKTRIGRIMSRQLVRKLNLGRRLMLGAAAILAVAAPIVVGALHATPRSAALQPRRANTAVRAYEIATIKLDEQATASLKTGKGVIRQSMMFEPGRFAAQNAAVLDLLRVAYDIKEYQISGAPDWFTSELYDIDARTGHGVESETAGPSDDQREAGNRRMLQALLATRFKLAVRRDTSELPVYSLAVADAGKLREAQGDCPATNIPQRDSKPGMPVLPPPPCGSLRVSLSGGLDGRKVPLSYLVQELANLTNRKVLDKTHLTAKYDIELAWNPDPGQFRPLPPALQNPGRPPLLTALQQQLGLTLEPQYAPVEMYIVYHAERPAGSQTQRAPTLLPAYASASITANKSGGDGVTLAFSADAFISKNASLQQAIRVAYGVEDDRIVGAPAWVQSEKYDVEAKAPNPGTDELSEVSFDRRTAEQKPMLQALLADRLKLALHRETRDLQVVALVIAKNGPKFQESKPVVTRSDGRQGADGIPRPGIWIDGSQLVGRGVGVQALLFHLSRQLHRTVVDQTGLSGTYDFTLNFPDGVRPGIDNTPSKQSSEPAIFAAIEQQLGLRLELRNASMEVVVIDHIEKPSEN